MKYREILLEQLKNQPFFTKKAFYQLSEQYALKKTTVDTYISRSLKRKEIIPLKNGFYVSADFYAKNKGNIAYSFYLANILRVPSYISSWTALQYYDLVTETIYPIISVTPKITRAYETKIGTFAYQSIKKDLFSDFFSISGKFNFFIAPPAKALFDLLYFKTHNFRGLKMKNVMTIISELRIDFDEMESKEKEKFYVLLNKYLK